MGCKVENRIIRNMAKIEDIPNMDIDELRPLVQRALELEAWPASDWIVVGMIFDEVRINISRMAMPPHAFSVTVMGMEIGGGIASASDRDPVTAIFRAFLAWKSYQVIEQKKNR